MLVFFKEDEIKEIISRQQDDNFGDLIRLKRESVSEDTRLNIMKFAPAPKLLAKTPLKRKKTRMRRRASFS